MGRGQSGIARTHQPRARSFGVSFGHPPLDPYYVPLMHVARRLVVFASVLGLTWGAYGLFRPLSEPLGVSNGVAAVEVSLPGFPASVNCGSVMDPQRARGGWDDLFGELGEIARGRCPAALDEQERLSFLWIAGSAVTGLAALVILRSPQRSAPAGSAGVGPFDVPQLDRLHRARALDVPEGVGLPDDRGSRRKIWIGGAIALASLAAGVAFLATTTVGLFSGFRWFTSEGRAEMSIGSTARSGDHPETVFAAEIEEVDLANERARLCGQRVLDRESLEWQIAANTSTRDRSAAWLNSDGDPSFVRYAQELMRVDLEGCSQPFSEAFASYFEAWSAYGSFLEEAARPHAPWNDEWSPQNERRRRLGFEARVGHAHSALRAEFERLGLVAFSARQPSGS